MHNNEEDIIDCLYRMYEQRMFHLAYGILHDEYGAEDAVHEAFLRLIRNRDKITSPESPAVRSYVYKTAKSAALDLYRKQKHRRENCVEYDETMDRGYSEESDSESVPLLLIAELPEKYAAVMRCLFIHGLSIRETAAVLKISEACVRKRCERARGMLRCKPDTKKQKELRHERQS